MAGYWGLLDNRSTVIWEPLYLVSTHLVDVIKALPQQRSKNLSSYWRLLNNQSIVIWVLLYLVSTELVAATYKVNTPVTSQKCGQLFGIT